MRASFGTVSFFRLAILSRIFPVFTLLALHLVAERGVAQTSVLTWHYDNSRTGADKTEMVLTPANVNYKTFGKLSTKPVDGYVAAQPLYVPNMTIAGKGVHNVVFVVTLHDSVYAFDADNTNTTPLWFTSIFTYSPPGATTVSTAVKRDPNTTGWMELGIVSTPVIDPVSDTLYLVAETYENSKVVHRLHALDITTGVEKLDGPTTIAASYTYNGVTTTFKDLYQMNRPGLLLDNSHILIAWGSNGNNNNSQGWFMSYSASTLQQLGAVTLEPGKLLASIWQKGAGIAADSLGNAYAVSGEGHYAVGSNLSISVAKFDHSKGVQLADFFTPYNHQNLSTRDMDLTGLLLLPPEPGTHPREMVSMGKEGTIYLLNRDKLGGLCTTCTSGDMQIVQEIPQGAGPEGGNPCFWNSRLYFTGAAIPVQAYTVRNGTLVVPPVKSPGSNPGGGHCFTTAKGSTNGILWFMNLSNLIALDAISLKTLYTSSQALNQRDVVPPVVHFPQPIAADGKVFVGTKNSLVTYGLL